ncbi:hypothetical protein J6590_010958 [Homalodisca vitripennis]|nr:hypothetical protein J6590_010958 [Homalodisca vitripennis]
MGSAVASVGTPTSQPANKQSSNRRRKRTSGKKRSPQLLDMASNRHSLRFPSISIESDSHDRDLAEIWQQLVTPKKGVDDGPPSLGSCSIIITGTNDVATGVQLMDFNKIHRLFFTGCIYFYRVKEYGECGDLYCRGPGLKPIHSIQHK